MGKIQNNFLKATVNKDLDERLTPNGQMTDASNVMVISEDAGNVGVLKNVKGNLKVTNTGIVGAVTIGSIADDSNERCFYFVKGADYDYIYEYNTESGLPPVRVLQSSTGGVLNFNEDYRISHADIFVSVEGESLLAWTDGFNPPRIVGIERAKSYPVDGFTEDEISVMKPSPVFAPTINMVNLTTTSSSNFLQDKFLQFAYRYKYEDGHYSAFSSWSQVAFVPSNFNLDYQTYENLGMLNLANAVEISFNSGSRHVIGIDLLFKESESSTVYVIDKFIKSEEGWTTPNLQITYTFYGNKIYSVLQESELFRSFDNVPLKAFTQARIGNRLVYGNFIEGRDIEEPVSLNVDYISNPLVLEEKDGALEDVVRTELYSNKVDFERGIEISGSSPVDQINYTTNEIEVDLTGSPDTARFSFEIYPKGVYFGTNYSVYVKEGSSVVASLENVSGNKILTYNRTTDGNISAYIVSDEGLIYDIKLVYRLTQLFVDVSKYEYFADDQLCYPKLGAYSSTLEGDTVINNRASFDFTDFQFTSGSQLRFQFELQSSLVYDVAPEFTYFYNLTTDYTDLSDFITNSNFVNDIENTFSNSFVNGTVAPYPYASAAGTVVSYEGFKINSYGNTLTITAPYVVYEVDEFNGVVTENKDDFYLIKSVLFGLYSEDGLGSMHSNRDYTCDIIYLDDKSRKTTVLSGGNTSVYIPSLDSDGVNKLVVETVSNPPSWAKYYKFAIKETKRNYNTIYGNVVYADGVYRWIQLVGENKSKVKEGDTLILKSDYSGICENVIQIKVLEVTTQAKDFLPDNFTDEDNPIVEDSGLYFKIKQGNFDINIDSNSFVTYEGFLKKRYAKGDKVYTKPLMGEYDETDAFVPTPVKNGSQIRFFARMYQFKNGGFDQSVEIIKFANNDYDSIRAWWEAEIADNQSWLNFADDRLESYGWDDNKRFYIASNKNGTARSDVRVNIVFDVKFSSGTLIFENYEEENLELPYFESVETYSIVGGNHYSGNPLAPNTHVLNKTFNCFTFGNGCESNCVKDSFVGKKFYINSNPTAISEDVYRQIHRYADLTYSGVYQESTNVNRLNEFNLSLANYKDDLEKSFGPIVVLSSDTTDLLVLQEDRCSKVLYGKDLLFNADATTNLSRIEDVLGQQVIYGGDYGISFNAESFVDYGTNKFFTDTKRGVVMRLNDSNGLMEISANGMRDYFKTLFRDNTILNIIGKYDSFFDVYIANIKYKKPNNTIDYVTWVYSDEAQGFLGKQTFNPDDMLRVNNHFLSFKGADVYKHNIGPYSTFYGVLNPSTFEFNFSQEPSTRKIFKNISIEGNSAWNFTLKTDMQNGLINYSDFKNKEGVYYGYIRGNDTLDLTTLSVSGIGVVSSILGNNVYFSGEIPSIISVGDKVYDSSLNLIGIITNIGSNYITLSSVVLVTNGLFLLSAKQSSAETSGIRGYYMNAKAEITTPNYVEAYAVNSEVAKSFE